MTSQSRHCHHCGNELVSGSDRFCSDCGAYQLESDLRVSNAKKRSGDNKHKKRTHFKFPAHSIRNSTNIFNNRLVPPVLNERLLEEEKKIEERTNGEWLPGDSSLRTWYANLRVAESDRFTLGTFELIVPNNYPLSPPIIRSLSTVKHRIIGRGGYVYLQILKHWSAYLSLYDVMVELKQVLLKHFILEPYYSRISYQGVDIPYSQFKASGIDRMLAEVHSLRVENDDEDENEIDLEKIPVIESFFPVTSEDQDIHSVETESNMVEKSSSSIELKAELLAAKESLDFLEKQFKSGHISINEYLKKHGVLTKDYYITKKRYGYVFHRKTHFDQHNLLYSLDVLKSQTSDQTSEEDL